MSVFKQRRERLLLLASGFDNVVVADPKNLYYLTGFWGGGWGIVRPDATVLVTSVMEEKRATGSSHEAEVVTAPVRSDQVKAVKRLLAKGRTLIDSKDGQVRGTVDTGPFIQARRKKDSEELSLIRGASERIDKIYEMLEKTIRPGLTELEIAAEVMKQATLDDLSPLAAEGSLSPIIIGSGENSAYPHAELTKRKVRSGDMIVADIFFRYRGYCSDCTRTYAVGRVRKEQRDGYEAVLEAERHGVKMVRRGESGRDIHLAVKAILKGHRLDGFFTHGTGHGVGIDIHESPSLGGKSEDTLQTGDVVTVEPGIYIPGDYGIRIEDTLFVGNDVEVLTKYDRELLIL
ncbi:MAG: Xaa-Pro peptidase family protein [Thaumarchaeota archaeon]|nr:Xaa-Pro peptidase family protein [Nitrososphaerota archaeon]